MMLKIGCVGVQGKGQKQVGQCPGNAYVRHGQVDVSSSDRIHRRLRGSGGGGGGYNADTRTGCVVPDGRHVEEGGYASREACRERGASSSRPPYSGPDVLFMWHGIVSDEEERKGRRLCRRRNPRDGGAAFRLVTWVICWEGRTGEGGKPGGGVGKGCAAGRARHVGMEEGRASGRSLVSGTEGRRRRRRRGSRRTKGVLVDLYMIVERWGGVLLVPAEGSRLLPPLVIHVSSSVSPHLSRTYISVAAIILSKQYGAGDNRSRTVIIVLSTVSLFVLLV
ncbi:hypothetical protein CBR_g24079 [Chara braunii]|uniref:Uncharacterized protein n=1 Tax=Chara braunii TaxID=69332 RepID=A0A388L5Z8_CHABU|nr:hypothetical protein CBR_g24079 [Chara braunii]|eukprot:GBG77633.1 hypothetical protein CBR_g24079 [Chara braunii]